MRLAGSKSSVNLDKIGDEEGVALVPEEPEDMWHANNLIGPGDTLKAHAVRKVVTESKTGSTASHRVHTELVITVTSTFFDPAASALHVSGQVISENSFVSLGQYHTLDLELHRPFTLRKKHGWDSVARRTLREALEDDKDGAVAAVIMQEGLANICLITDFQTLLKQRVEHSVPKKRGGDASETDKSMDKFYEKTLASLTRAIDFTAGSRTLLLASPGFVAEGFKRYIAKQEGLEGLAKDCVVTHSSSGHVHSLAEVLNNAEVSYVVRAKKFKTETIHMDEFYARLRRDDGRAWYGVSCVEKAVREGAVGRGGGVLLVNNSLFRSQDINIRRRYVALVDKVKEDGGEARILSSDHESGQRLDNLGGIAAILTFPMYDLDEDNEEEVVARLEIVDEDAVKGFEGHLGGTGQAGDEEGKATGGMMGIGADGII